MKIIKGVKYYSIGEVAKEISRSPRTIKNWYEWANIEERQHKLPVYRTDLDLRGTRFFKEEDIKVLMRFRNSISYGQMSNVSRTKWGERGRIIAKRDKK